MSNDLYVPSLPLVAAGLAAGGGAVQLTLSTLLLGLSAGALIYGPLSDQYGRKPVLAAGLAVYVVAGVMAALADSLAVLVLWRFLQGLGAAAGSVLARAIILDRWRGEQASRVLSWMAIVTFLSPVLAPLVGGQIAALGAMADDLLGACRGRRAVSRGRARRRCAARNAIARVICCSASPRTARSCATGKPSVTWRARRSASSASCR